MEINHIGHIHFQGLDIDNFCKSSQLCLTTAVMTPLMLPGSFNLVTDQTANECFTSVFMRASRHISGLSEINGISHNMVISTSVSRRTQSRNPQDVTHCSRTELMDLGCGMSLHSGAGPACRGDSLDIQRNY